MPTQQDYNNLVKITKDPKKVSVQQFATTLLAFPDTVAITLLKAQDCKIVWCFVDKITPVLMDPHANAPISKDPIVQKWLDTFFDEKKHPLGDYRVYQENYDVKAILKLAKAFVVPVKKKRR